MDEKEKKIIGDRAFNMFLDEIYSTDYDDIKDRMYNCLEVAEMFHHTERKYWESYDQEYEEE